MTRIRTQSGVTRPAIFIDKDDTLVRDVPYNVCPALIDFLPGSLEAVSQLRGRGYAIVVVTNQSGIARGYFDLAQLDRYLEALENRMRESGATPDSIGFCPHHPDATVRRFRRICACRKPNPGLLTGAAAELGLELERSWMIGDLLDDVEAGARAGCSTALVSAHEDQVPPPAGVRRPDLVVSSLAEFARIVPQVPEAVA